MKRGPDDHQQQADDEQRQPRADAIQRHAAVQAGEAEQASAASRAADCVRAVGTLTAAPPSWDAVLTQSGPCREPPPAAPLGAGRGVSLPGMPQPSTLSGAGTGAHPCRGCPRPLPGCRGAPLPGPGVSPQPPVPPTTLPRIGGRRASLSPWLPPPCYYRAPPFLRRRGAGGLGPQVAAMSLAIPSNLVNLNSSSSKRAKREARTA